MKILAIEATGSWVTCSPPVLDTDQDWLVLVEDLDAVGQCLIEQGWEDCFVETTEGADAYRDEQKYGMRFHAYRREQTNYIVTDDKTYYLLSLGATFVAKHLNLLDKADRIALFRMFKYGETYNGRVK